MKFEDFFKLIPKITNLPLPGQSSHYKMAPEERKILLDQLDLTQNKAKEASVLSLIYPDHRDVAQVLLILRKTYQGVHSNQVGFPGGRIEKTDEDRRAAALRETEEEVGIPPVHISIFKALTEVYIPPSNFMVYPFMGVMNSTPSFIPDAREVESILEVPLATLLDDAAIFNPVLPTSYSVRIKVPAFKLEGHTVWGATAMMLSEVKDLIKQVL